MSDWPALPQFVTTESGSVYRIDWAASTVARHYDPKTGRRMRRDGETLTLHASSELVVGQPFRMILSGLRDDAWTERTTSLVTAIRDEVPAERISEMMEQKLLTAEQVTHSAKITSWRFAQIMNGHPVTDDELDRLAEVLAVKRDWLRQGWHWNQRPLRFHLVAWWLDQNDIDEEPWPPGLPEEPTMPGMPRNIVAGAITGYRRGVVPLDVLSELLDRYPDDFINLLDHRPDNGAENE